jgi:hypothetical protein
MLTHADAMRIIEDMLLVCQKVKSNVEDPVSGLADWATAYDLEETRLREDLYSWLFGPKDVMPLLADLALGTRPLVDGQTVFNLMIIAHRLCPVIAMIAPLRLPDGRELPTPDVMWCTIHWPSTEQEN